MSVVRRHVAVLGIVVMCLDLIRPTEGRRTLTLRQGETIFLDCYVEAKMAYDLPDALFSSILAKNTANWATDCFVASRRFIRPLVNQI